MKGEFSNLVSHYQANLIANVMFDARYPGQEPECQLLISKLEKHEKAGDVRKMAYYLALFRQDFPGTKIPELAKTIGKRNGIIYDPVDGFGYPHADGGYHYFK